MNTLKRIIQQKLNVSKAGSYISLVMLFKKLTNLIAQVASSESSPQSVLFTNCNQISYRKAKRYPLKPKKEIA
ncbi:MAG: hypothetical protein AAGJ93_03695 [Bacteroidota bacterium]